MKYSCFCVFGVLGLMQFGCDYTPGGKSAQATTIPESAHHHDRMLAALPDQTPHKIKLSEPRWVVPANNLPKETAAGHSNNNLDIVEHDGRLFFSWRTAATHFASTGTKMFVVSSTDGGQSWQHELTLSVGADVREPRFLSLNGKLHLYYFEGGSDSLKFEPKHLWRMQRTAVGKWTKAKKWGEPGEVMWDVKVRNGIAYMTSYVGNNYGAGESALKVFWRQSKDGITWTPVGGSTDPVVYFGGVSESAFEFDKDGNVWAVTRNEDGDNSGFGSHLCMAKRESLGKWECPKKSNPDRFDSPEMFRYKDEIYLIARRDIGGPFDRNDRTVTGDARKGKYLVAYSLRPKRTALYRIDREARRIRHIQDLPSAGDTAYPAVIPNGPDSFLLANYTSPLQNADWSWIRAQLSEQGTQIYFMELSFSRR